MASALLRKKVNCPRHLPSAPTNLPTRLRYTFTARVLHWITALLVLTMIPLGVVIANEWGGSAQNSLYDLHRSIGVTIIPLVILRIIYRWTYPPLPLPADIPAMQRLAAYATHWGLYVLLIVQPFTGWIATSAYRAPVTFFGWFELPPIWPENRALSEELFSVHNLIGIAIACLAAARTRPSAARTRWWS